MKIEPENKMTSINEKMYRNSDIFIVDDDIPFTKSLTRLVKSIGYEVQTHTSTEEFLETVPYKGPSCLLLDVGMQDLTGPVLQRKLAKRKFR